MFAWVFQGPAEPEKEPIGFRPQRDPRDDAFFHYRPMNPVLGLTARNRPPKSADITQPHPMTSVASFQSDQCAHDRPLKEDTFKMTQVSTPRTHLLKEKLRR
jgi:hypothetical protein